MKKNIFYSALLLLFFSGCETGGAGSLSKQTSATLIDSGYALSPSDMAAGGEFGAALAKAGAYVAVGAPFAERVYCFQKVAGEYRQIHLLSSSFGSELFGWSVGVAGEYLAAGAPLNERVYLFKGNGTLFVPVGMVSGSDTIMGDGFGNSLAMQGEFLAAGAPYRDESGAVYLFKLNGTIYEEVAKINAPDATSGERFGSSLAMDATHLLVGAPQKEPGGAAYLFAYDENGSVSEVAKLLLADGIEGDGFGVSVAQDGNYSLIGAPGRDTAAGVAYLYKNDGNDTVSLVTQLTISDAGEDEMTAWSVALEGEYLLLGSYLKGDKGAVYLFKNDGNDSINEEVKYAVRDGRSGDWFGRPVLIEEGTALMGATQQNGTGAVYYQTLP